MQIHFAEYIRDGRENRLYKHYTVTGDTETDCFEKIYTGYIRPSRYCNDRYYELDDPAQNERFDEWKQYGVTIEMFYGSGTVD